MFYWVGSTTFYHDKGKISILVGLENYTFDFEVLKFTGLVLALDHLSRHTYITTKCTDWMSRGGYTVVDDVRSEPLQEMSSVKQIRRLGIKSQEGCSDDSNKIGRPLQTRYSL